MVKTVMIVGGQRKNLPFFWLDEFPGTERGKMYCQINAGGLYGLQSYVAQVEVDISKGLPCFDMVGLLDSEVREARERLRVSLHHINAALPAEKITVNYSPAGIVKSGTSFDLPTALVILAAQGKVPPERLRELWAVGEVGLDARIKQVRGVLAMLHAANQSAFRSYLIPFENLGEGLAVGKLPVMGVCSLEEAMEYVNASAQEQERMRRDAEDRWQSQAKGRREKEKKTPDFALLCGMEEAKRAAMIAAAEPIICFWQDRRYRKDDACEVPAGNPAAHERGRKAGGVCNLQRGRAAGGWNADSGATVCQPASYGICLCNDRRRRCPKTGNGDVGAPGRVVFG